LGDSAVTVSEGYRDGVDEDNYKFRSWEADYKGLAFNVTSQQEFVYGGLGGEFGSRYYVLSTNYYERAAGALLEAYEGEKELLQIGDYYADGLNLFVAMKDRANYDRAYAAAKGYYDLVLESGTSIPFRFYFRVPDYKFRDYSDHEEDKTFYVNTLDEATYHEILGKYCVYMNAYLAADGFTEEEILRSIDDYGLRFKVTKGETVYTFADLNSALIDKVYLTYETMYEVLLRCGFDVAGTTDDFSFTGSDGSVYSLGRKYYEEDYVEWWAYSVDFHYYLKDGERVDLDWTNSGYNYLYKSEDFPALTGMTIEEID
jgi:hypothetical protein